MNESDTMNDDALMIARGKLATLKLAIHEKRHEVNNLTALIEFEASEVRRMFYVYESDITIAALETILASCATLHTLCTSIAALKAEMDALQAIAWPAES